jgi:hypothetical protein
MSLLTDVQNAENGIRPLLKIESPPSSLYMGWSNA